MGIVQRKLNNGMRVNMVSMGDEPQRVSVRMYVPGGRMLESKTTPGSVLVGSRTIQEGGAFLDVTRYSHAGLSLICTWKSEGSGVLWIDISVLLSLSFSLSLSLCPSFLTLCLCLSPPLFVHLILLCSHSLIHSLFLTLYLSLFLSNSVCFTISHSFSLCVCQRGGGAVLH